MFEAVIIFILIWILLPLFLIPYSLSVRSKNIKLRNQLESYEKEFRTKYIPQNNIPSVQPQVQMHKTCMEGHDPEKTDRPVYASDVIHEQEPRAINISVLMVIGVILVILAGLIYATTSWSDMSNSVRTLTVISGSVFFFAVSAFSEKKLKLDTTGKAFFILGCFFLPVSVVAISFFKMFGEWFSFEGDGNNIVFMVIFLTASLAAAAGVVKYRFRTAAVISMASFSLALYSLTTYSHSSAAVTVTLAAYSFILISVKFKGNEKTVWLRPYHDIFEMFSGINAICLAILSFIYAFFDPSENNRSGFAAFAVLFLIAGTVVLMLRSENSTHKDVSKFVIACEYIAFSVLCIIQIEQTADISPDLLNMILAALFIPAFIVFRFVPVMKSESSCILTAFTEFIICMQSDERYETSAFILLAFLIISEVTETKDGLRSGYAAVIPASVFIAVCSLNLSDLKSSYIYISVICMTAFITLLFSGKSDILKKLSFSSGIYAMVATPVIVFIADDQAYSYLLAISSAALIAVSAYLLLKKENKYVSVTVLISSLHIQFFVFMKLLYTELFEADSTGLYIISVIVTIMIVSTGLFLSLRYRPVGTGLVRSSWLFVSFVLLNDFPGASGNWRFVFALCFCMIIAANGYTLTDQLVKRIMYTVAAGFVSAALMVQNFISIPQIIKAEYYAAASLFIYIFLRKIWDENRRECATVFFVHSGLCIFILMMLAISSNKPEDAIILASICSVIVICSFIVKSRRWLYLGGASLIILVFYITRDFWMSIAWWVYLLTAGIVFISFAGINEYCRITGKENVILTKLKTITRSGK